MPKMNGSGPVGQGQSTGRELGNCSNLTNEEKLEKLGVGMGKRRKVGGGTGKKKRKQEGNQ